MSQVLMDAVYSNEIEQIKDHIQNDEHFLVYGCQNVGKSELMQSDVIR